ncbi:unnamed protein product [Fraxinus pennsylvanica]|uniref:Uncharacterized protein n=1 Tax=Fraxinus pennsylvanica TaxID=56036 RepID=A0AAD1ZWM3_9LAMI|nr:unnamed protein product [Fraxinus pennsylvanica]
MSAHFEVRFECHQKEECWNNSPLRDQAKVDHSLNNEQRSGDGVDLLLQRVRSQFKSSFQLPLPAGFLLRGRQQRKRTKIKCNSCGKLVGYIYDDGAPMTDSPGQFHMGPSQVVPRNPRYRFKTKALRIASET